MALNSYTFIVQLEKYFLNIVFILVHFFVVSVSKIWY